MQVTFRTPGKTVELDLPENTTVAELLWDRHYRDEDIVVFLNERQAFPDDVLADGDRLFASYPFVGAAPLPPGNIPEGIRQLQKFTADAVNLVVIDPYITKPKFADEGDKHVKLIAESTCLADGKLKSLSIVDSFRNGKRPVKDALATECGRYGCAFQYHQTGDIHDRLWIKNGQQAALVGTSLNSIGARLAFMVDLPSDDFKYLKDFLQRRQYL